MMSDAVGALVRLTSMTTVPPASVSELLMASVARFAPVPGCNVPAVLVTGVRKNPLPPSVPAVMFTGLFANVPFTSNVPPFTVVRPEWELLAVSVSVPKPPVVVNPPVPLMVELTVSELFASPAAMPARKIAVPFSDIVPASVPVVPPFGCVSSTAALLLTTRLLTVTVAMVLMRSVPPTCSESPAKVTGVFAVGVRRRKVSVW